MLKMSLLYADTVTLYSPVLATYLGIVNSTDGLTYEGKLELLIRLRPLVGRSDMADIEQDMLDTYKELFPLKESAKEGLVAYRRAERAPPPELRGVLQQLTEQLNFIETHVDKKYAEISSILLDIRSDLGLQNFDEAVGKGLLKIGEMNIDKLEALEFALRAYNGLELTDALDAPSKQFTDVLMRLLFTSSKTYPLLDAEIGELLKLQPEFEEVTVSKVQAQKAKHASFASSLFEQLPTFTEITLDEILDLRRELSTSLVAFRGAVAEYTELLESDVWDEDFNAEADKVYKEKVKPAVEAIRLKVEDQSALRSLARISESSLSPLIVIGVGAVSTSSQSLNNSFEQLAALGLISIGYNAIVEVKQRKREWDNLKNEKIFFYYKMTKKYGE